jgi:hypothetical protein
MTADQAGACTRSHPHEAMSSECELRTEIARLTNSGARIKATNAELAAALIDLLAITKDSHGVAGYHLNGRVAEWDEFPEFEQALAALEKHKGTL